MMAIDFLDKKFEEIISAMPEKQQVWARKFKLFYFSIIEKYVKPFLISISMFYVFYRIKARIGMEESIFVLLIIVVIMLRQLLSKFS